jgi:hypothetical protein
MSGHDPTNGKHTRVPVDPSGKMFRVLNPGKKTPHEIPWEFVEPLRASCLRAHHQSLELLNNRGGLSPREIYLHVQGAKLPWRVSNDGFDCDAWLVSWIAAGTSHG